jgi:hypothetical protein
LNGQPQDCLEKHHCILGKVRSAICFQGVIKQALENSTAM